MDKFIVTLKEDKTVTMTIRIDRSLQEQYNDLANKTNRSRNELISMALRYALEHMEIQLDGQEKKTETDKLEGGDCDENRKDQLCQCLC